jgi:hypothetical protein
MTFQDWLGVISSAIVLAGFLGLAGWVVYMAAKEQ